MKTKIVKWGNSLGLRIPKSFAEEVQVAEGSTVDLSLEDGRLVIRVTSQLKYSLEELLGGMTENNLHSEVKSGKPVGAAQSRDLCPVSWGHCMVAVQSAGRQRAGRPQAGVGDFTEVLQWARGVGSILSANHAYQRLSI